MQPYLRGLCGALAAVYAASGHGAPFPETFRAFLFGIGVASDYAGSPARRSMSVDPELDPVGKACMQCHGSHGNYGAVAITAKSAGTPMQFDGYRSVDHPVGMLYGDSYNRDPFSYRPESALGGDIRLVNGRVSCVTCHQMRTADAEAVYPAIDGAHSPAGCLASKQLARGSAGLCMSCHIN